MSSPNDNDESQPLLLYPLPSTATMATQISSYRARTRKFMRTKTKHYIIMAMVALDVAVILADIFVALIACDLHLPKEGNWVQHTREGLHITATVFSGLFLVELLIAVWAFGVGFFKEWFHCFDAFVIVASFIIDVVTHGTLEEIGSLIIILRLWRFVKIVDELGVSAEERTEGIESKLVALEMENESLKRRIEEMRGVSIDSA
ncbi:hypothetical protein QBC34DRAFT_381751 [Podospora aff. communis PSN243]|uniref:Voltage-gated hydrogen channel 1 n=1 Tax=Podospora aff. communis PSN243 TaxID=3040156 RepID=A0AAV9GJ13_9PEZI|nr:hypothetical protein QBC34DRAFT_381751 [Podospora aff. communis PSN243]